MEWNNMKHYAYFTVIGLMSFSCFLVKNKEPYVISASIALADPQRVNAASYFKPEEREKWSQVVSHGFIILGAIKWMAWACLCIQNYQNYTVGKIA